MQKASWKSGACNRSDFHREWVYGETAARGSRTSVPSGRDRIFWHSFYTGLPFTFVSHGKSGFFSFLPLQRGKPVREDILWDPGVDPGKLLRNGDEVRSNCLLTPREKSLLHGTLSDPARPALWNCEHSGSSIPHVRFPPANRNDPGIDCRGQCHRQLQRWEYPKELQYQGRDGIHLPAIRKVS